MIQLIVDFFKQFGNLAKQLGGHSWKVSKDVGKKLRPQQVHSWQSYILSSVFLALISFLATEFFAAVAALFGQIALVIGLYFLGIELGIFLTPWIIAALISVLLYVNLMGVEGVSEAIPRFAVVVFPIIAAVIHMIPRIIIIQEGDRQKEWKYALRLFGSHLLIACWIQFFFVIQSWLEIYPTFLAEDFSNSAFVVKVNLQQQPIPSKGKALLDGVGTALKQELDERPWELIQPLSPETLDSRIDSIKQVVGATVTSPQENQLWTIQRDFTANSSGYTALLTAIWKGPRTQLQAKDSEKLCIIKQGFSATDRFQEPVVKVECEPAKSIVRAG